ncbi:MAG: type I glyceraldehyde-3-phosphate dehydrogenase [Candidatus Harrisonbacteria bacterium CG10_big_fil_rev_8_21_14_0_10_44_23]|uniref:Type I glyceraldehyde-3-phosphate dehydrogenase n=1 Tax=Candidatus Harrisonbacteria bacterium CG10_big_fil_rev_8_21_14_0_10_44_23 TaxID=1974585 RepID=A0A2H0UQ59_9BACT|nr:MAG: type I glyceraldehyde-3-phosphate dehydrogenase [Candidatus Harrisonbacteria bacterium CG10_big_fil_rev_8_21_14_0_10_44_23]
MRKIAINGFGRIGRLFLRQALEEPGMRVVAINDLGDINNLAYLLKYDSVYRTLDKKISIIDDELVVDGKKIKVFQEKDPANLPWADMGIDIVVEATGIFTKFETAGAHITKAGARRVVITAPAKDEEGKNGGKTVLMGVNEGDLATCKISSNGSCTTNAVSPLIAILSKSLGIEKAILNTVHGYTATQSLTDGPTRSKDVRRGRAAAQNIIPSTTGAAIATTRAIPELSGKFDGIAMRVPVLVGSIVDLTFVSKKITTPEEINAILREAAETKNWKNLIKVVDAPIVSSDIIGEPYGAIIDTSYTKVVDGTLCKVLSWYDNEWGYVKTLVEHVKEAIKTL